VPRLIEPGTYRAKVYGVWFKYATTGTPQICISFETHAEVPEDVGRITAFRALTTNTWEKFVKKELLALGWDADKRTAECGGNLPIEEIEGEKSVLIGRECSIKVVEEEDQVGKPRLVVKFINGLDGGRRPEMAPEAKQDFVSRLRASLTGKGPAPKTGAAVPATAASSQPKDLTEAAAQARENRPAPPKQKPDDYDFNDIPF